MCFHMLYTRVETVFSSAFQGLHWRELLKEMHRNLRSNPRGQESAVLKVLAFNVAAK